MEESRDGGMVEWRDGGMEGWWDGGMEGWRLLCEGMVREAVIKKKCIFYGNLP